MLLCLARQHGDKYSVKYSKNNTKNLATTVWYHIWSPEKTRDFFFLHKASGLKAPNNHFHKSYVSQNVVMLNTKIEIMDFLVFLLFCFFSYPFSYSTCKQSTYTKRNKQTHTHTHIEVWPRPVVSEDCASSRLLIGPISPPLFSPFVLTNAPATLSDACFWKDGHSVPCSYPNTIKLRELK